MSVNLEQVPTLYSVMFVKNIYLFNKSLLFVHNLCLFQDDIEIPIPKYFTYENSKVLQEREKMLGGILAKMGPQETTPVSNLLLKKQETM